MNQDYKTEAILRPYVGILELDISGVPGIGKTACVLEIVEELKKDWKFVFIPLNGLKLSKPSIVYSQLYQNVFGQSSSSETACKLLGKHT